MNLNDPSTVLDVRALPGSCETLAVSGGGQFPVLAALPDGDLLAVLRGGAGHLGLAGRIEVVRSRDGGATWSPPVIVADSEWDDRNPALGVTPAGTVVLAYHRTGCYDAEGRYVPDKRTESGAKPVEVMVTCSHDGGHTWRTPAPLNLAALRTGSPFGKIVALADGTLCMAVYGGVFPEVLGARLSEAADALYGSYLVRSRDDGATWESPTVIAVGFNETGLLALPNGELLAVARGNVPRDALAEMRSADGGETWSPPEFLTEARQHPADLLRLSDGTILLTYGNRTPPYRVEGRVSTDDGRTWHDRLLAFSGPLYGANVVAPRRTDLGYPSSVRHPATGTGVTVYYYDPSIPHVGDWRGENGGVFYRADTYRAVAVSWNEAGLLAAIRER